MTQGSHSGINPPLEPFQTVGPTPTPPSKRNPVLIIGIVIATVLIVTGGIGVAVLVQSSSIKTTTASAATSESPRSGSQTPTSTWSFGAGSKKPGRLPDAVLGLPRMATSSPSASPSAFYDRALYGSGEDLILITLVREHQTGARQLRDLDKTITDRVDFGNVYCGQRSGSAVCLRQLNGGYILAYDLLGRHSTEEVGKAVATIYDSFS